MGEAVGRLCVGTGRTGMPRGGRYYHSSVLIGRKISVQDSRALAAYSGRAWGRPRRYRAEGIV